MVIRMYSSLKTALKKFKKQEKISTIIIMFSVMHYANYNVDNLKCYDKQRGKQWRQQQNSFLGAPKSLQMVTAAMKLKDACSLEKKAMTNLDSILKSRDVTFLTKVHIVNDMAFPVVIYGCERWTIKKAEHQRINAFEL